MRTKHLLLALAVPALFAACQQDDFTTEGVNNDALQGRKSIGQVTFVTSDAETRWVNEGDYNSIIPEAGDGLSVNLVDVPGYYGDQCLVGSMHEYAIDNYRLVDFVNTNYEFKYKSGTGWTNEGNLVEGNYLIVSPYIKSESRKPLEAVLPAVQTVTVKDGKAVANSPLQNILADKENPTPMQVAFKFLEAGKTSNVEVEYMSLYAYPKITIKNTDRYRGDLVLDQVVIEALDGFVLKAPLSADGVRNAMINQVFENVNQGGEDQVLMGSWAAAGLRGVDTKGRLGDTADGYVDTNYDGLDVPFSWYTAADGSRKKSTSAYVRLCVWDGSYYSQIRGAKGAKNMPWTAGLGATADKAPKTSDLLDTKDAKRTNYIVVNMSEPITLKYGEETTFNVVMPAQTFTNGRLKIYARFSANNITWCKTLKTTGGVITLPNKQYPREAYTDNHLAFKGDKDAFFTVYTNEQDRDYGTYQEADVPNTGSPETPYVAVVKTQEELAQAVQNASADKEWTIVCEGEGLVWNAKVNELVSTRNQYLFVQGAITVKDVTVKDYVCFEDATIEGTVTIAGNNTKVHDILVSKDATLTLKTGDVATQVVNLGTLNLYKADVEVYNFGRLNLYCDSSTAKIHCQTDKCRNHTELLSDRVSLEPSIDIQKGATLSFGQPKIMYPIYVRKGGTLNLTTSYVDVAFDAMDECGKEYYFNNPSQLYVYDGGIVTSSVSGGTTLTVQHAYRDYVTIEDDAVVDGVKLNVTVYYSYDYNKNEYYGPYYANAKEYNKDYIHYDVKYNGVLVIGSVDDPIEMKENPTTIDQFVGDDTKITKSSDKATITAWIWGTNKGGKDIKPYYYVLTDYAYITSGMVAASETSNDRLFIMLSTTQTIEPAEDVTSLRVRKGSGAGSENVTLKIGEQTITITSRSTLKKETSGWNAYVDVIDAATGKYVAGTELADGSASKNSSGK